MAFSAQISAVGASKIFKAEVLKIQALIED